MEVVEVPVETLVELPPLEDTEAEEDPPTWTPPEVLLVELPVPELVAVMELELEELVTIEADEATDPLVVPIEMLEELAEPVVDPVALELPDDCVLTLLPVVPEPVPEVVDPTTELPLPVELLVDIVELVDPAEVLPMTLELDVLCPPEVETEPETLVPELGPEFELVVEPDIGPPLLPELEDEVKDDLLVNELETIEPPVLVVELVTLAVGVEVEEPD